MAKKTNKKFIPTRFMLPTSHYDKERADHAVAFIENLKHTKGIWSGQPFKLLDWQDELIRNVFGVIKSNGYRQFNTVFTEIPKKTGKSELAAAVALYMLCADDEQGAEIYGCATDTQQATIVFSVALDMIRQCPALMRRVKTIDSRKRIIYEPTRSIYQVLSSEVASKYGYNVHACIFDELLGQSNRKLYDVMTKGAGAARRQPLNFVITTAGTDKNSICYEVHSKAIDILEGRKHDSTFYPVVYSAPEDADWTDPKVWRSVNPSLGVTVEEEYLRLSCESAKQNVAEEMQFRQFFLCQWTPSAKRWMPMDMWDKCAAEFIPKDLWRRECYAGLDLSSTIDITAFVLVFPPLNEDDKYWVLPYFWIPEENVDLRVRRDHVPYDVWKAKGHMKTTEGNVVDYRFLQKDILDICEQFNVKEIAYDRWNATELVLNLEDEGLTMVRFGQGYQSMNSPTKDLLRLVLTEELVHNGNPVMNWMADNATVKMDPAGNIKLDKGKASEKIDGLVALVMGLSRALVHTNQDPSSVYDERGLIIIL